MEPRFPCGRCTRPWIPPREDRATLREPARRAGEDPRRVAISGGPGGSRATRRAGATSSARAEGGASRRPAAVGGGRGGHGGAARGGQRGGEEGRARERDALGRGRGVGDAGYRGGPRGSRGACRGDRDVFGRGEGRGHDPAGALRRRADWQVRDSGSRRGERREGPSIASPILEPPQPRLGALLGEHRDFGLESAAADPLVVRLCGDMPTRRADQDDEVIRVPDRKADNGAAITVRASVVL